MDCVDYTMVYTMLQPRGREDRRQRIAFISILKTSVASITGGCPGPGCE